MARFSQTLDERDAQLRNLLANANKATGVLAERSDQVVSLVANTNALLAQLQNQSRPWTRFQATSRRCRKAASRASSPRTARPCKPALDKLNGVLTIVDNRKEQVQQSIKRLNAYAMSLGESVASGPFFKAYLANLLPGQFVQPFVDAAFSDLGLDPNVLLPSQRTDPQAGQPGTPALPVPYPRTGQGGEPNLTLPDAITGKPGRPVLSVPGAVARPRLLPAGAAARARRRAVRRRARPAPDAPAPDAPSPVYRAGTR